MSARVLVVVQRLALLAALLASAALIIDYQNIGDPTFCGAESPCFKVRASELGKQLAAASASIGLSVPHVGVLAHVFLLAASLGSRSRAMVRMVAAFATLGGLAAAGLIAAQLSIGELCKWCFLVDGAAIIAAIASVQLARLTKDEASAAWAREAGSNNVVLLWAAGAAAMVALPFIWAQNPEAAPRPASIEAQQVPGKVTVLSFTDFECPFCRNLAPSLEGLKKDPRVAFKRLMAPLHFHPGAEPAALGYLCVDEERKEPMAAALYEASSGQLTTRGVAAIAQKVGQPDPEAFAACVKSDATRAALDADIATFESSGGTGLPTTWVGRRVVKGFRPDQVARAFSAEVGGAGVALPIWAMFVVAAAIGGGLTFAHRRAAKTAALEEQKEAEAVAAAAAAAAAKKGAKGSKKRQERDTSGEPKGKPTEEQPEPKEGGDA